MKFPRLIAVRLTCTLLLGMAACGSSRQGIPEDATSGSDSRRTNSDARLPQAAADAAAPVDALSQEEVASPDVGLAANNDAQGTADAMPSSSDTLEGVHFSKPESTIREADTAIEITVALPSASTAPVQVDFAVERTQARNHGRCSPQDFWLDAGTLTFSPGETKKAIPVVIKNDTFFEADERIVLALSNAKGAPLGASRHTLIIVDDDRPQMVSVKDHGAIGDGKTEDTAAIQKAVDTLYAAGGGVLYFPAGAYLVKSITIEPGITYVGYEARFARPAMMGKWMRTFTTQSNKANADERPLVIQGLTFNGNSQQQGPYRNHEVEQAHLVFITGGTEAKRTQVYVEDTRFEDGVGDGLSIYTNVDAKACHIDMRDLFRGGFTLTGGSSSSYVYDFVTKGPRDPTGMDIEIDSGGTEGRKTFLIMERSRLDSTFDLGINGEGSVATIRDVIVERPIFYIATDLVTTITITDSVFWFGRNDSFNNRLVRPGNVVFDHVDFHKTEDDSGEADRKMWLFDVYPFSTTGCHVQARNSRFLVADTVESSDQLFLARYPGAGNKITIEGGTIDPKFDGVFENCPSCVHNKSGGDGTPPGPRKIKYPEDASGKLRWWPNY